MKNLVLKSVFVVATLGCGLMSQEAWAGKNEPETLFIASAKALAHVLHGTGSLFKSSADYISKHKDVAGPRGLIAASIGAGLFLFANKLRLQFLGSLLFGLGALVAWEGYAARKTTGEKIGSAVTEGTSAVKEQAKAVIGGGKNLLDAIKDGTKEIDNSLQKVTAKTPFNRAADLCGKGEKGLLAMAQSE